LNCKKYFSVGIIRAMIYLILVFIGFANALPVSLGGSNLSIFLREYGFEKESIGLFSLLSIPFTLKLLWSPLIDTVSLPFFKNSPRKGWMLFALCGMALSLMGIALSFSTWMLSLSYLSLSTFAGCLFMIGIAYELESVDDSYYSIGSASSIAGYRTGLLFGGAGALYIASIYSWPVTFALMAFMVFLSGCIVFLQPEPYKAHQTISLKTRQFKHYPSLISAFWQEIVIKPTTIFFARADWRIVLITILLFKVGDHLGKVMEGPFYLDSGFSKTDLALASKTWGFATAILGAFTAGIFIKNRDPISSVAYLGLLHAASSCGYLVQALVGKSYLVLYCSVTFASFTGAMAITAFIFMLWRVAAKEYAAVLYALMWSLFSFNANILSCLGAFLAASLSWPTFYLFITFISLSAALTLVVLTRKVGKLVIEN
jgi:PAT family beta-lactamase induction signal transducer AmpG